MITERKIKEIQRETCYELVRARVRDSRNTLDAAMKIIEATHDDAELTGDKRYCQLCSLYEKMGEVLEQLGEDVKTSTQSPEPCPLQNHQNCKIRDLRCPDRLARLNDVCRILQDLPGYKLHLSGLAIENTGDLSLLSRSKLVQYGLLMQKDFLVRNAKDYIETKEREVCHEIAELKVKERHTELVTDKTGIDRRKIYDLLCEVIKEAELGKKECIRDDFESWRLCDHAWENIETLVDKIAKTLTAKYRSTIELRRADTFSKVIDSKNSSINNLSEGNNIFGIVSESDHDASFEDRPFPGIL